MKYYRSLKNTFIGSVIGSVALIGTMGVAHAGTYKDTSTYKDVSVIDMAGQKGDFSMFLKAIDAAGLEDTLSKADGITLFLPTDVAFNDLPKETLDELMSDEGKDKLKNILSYHVIEKEINSNDISTDPENIETLLGKTIEFELEGDTAKINEASIVTADLTTKNGVVHVIDKVLIPAES